MHKEYYYPTQVYFTDLAAGDVLNPELIPHIYAWREADPDGVVHTNAPQLGAWHSPTDMHTRREFYPLLRAGLRVHARGVRGHGIRPCVRTGV
jgi:hypothetical protein